MDELTELKQKYLDAVKITKQDRECYLESKQDLKAALDYLRVQKRTFGQCYKNWKASRKAEAKAYRKWRAYPSQVRQWTKKNLDKALEVKQ